MDHGHRDTGAHSTGTQGHTVFTPAYIAMDMDKDMYMDIGYGH